MKVKNIQEYLGTLQQTIVTSWRKHLKSSKYNEHVILNDFYDDMLDAVDELTEAYMSKHGKIEGYVNVFKNTKKLSPYEYVKMIYEFTKENRDIVGDESEIQGLVDDVLAVCDTAIYKLKELTEKEIMDLKDFINESLDINESNIISDMEIGQIVKGGGYYFKKISSSKFQELSWDPVHKRAVELSGMPTKTARQVEIQMDYYDDVAIVESLDESSQPDLDKLKSKCKKLMKINHKNESEAKKAFDKLSIDDYDFDDFCEDLNDVLNDLYDHVFDATDGDAVYDFDISDEINNIAEYEFDDNVDEIADAIIEYWNLKR